MEGLNTQYHIQCDPKDIGRYVIIPGDPDRVPKIAALFDDCYEVGHWREFNIYSGHLEGELVTVCSSGIGGPSSAIAMEELHNMGADTFIRCGTCGGINPDVKAGDVIVANAAIRYEHTSHEYAPLEYPAVCSFDITYLLGKASVDLGYTTHVGVVQCKDSFYGQHSPKESAVSYELLEKWDAWKRLGVLASEMETSTLCVIGALKRCRVGACFHVVWNQEREALGLPQERQFDTSHAIKVAVEAMRQTIKTDKDRSYYKKNL